MCTCRLPLLTAAAMLVHTGLHAQEAGSPAPFALPDILVTGERIERSIARTGASVIAIPAPELRDRHLDDASQVFRRTPNVAISDDNRDVVIRGIPAFGLGRNEDVLTLVPDNAVATFLDGVPISTWAGATSLWDIERVEVFRGPQTTTSGRGALGGAIFLVSPDPTPEWTAGVRLGAGTQSSSALSGVVSGPLVADRLGIRIALDRQENAGEIDNITVGTNQNPDRHLTSRVRLVFTPTDGVRFAATWTHSDRRRGGGLVSLADWSERRITRNDIADRVDKTVDVAALTFSIELAPDLTLAGITGLGRENANRVADGDLTALPLSTVRVDEESRQANQEVRLSYLPPGGPLSGFIGIFAGYFDRTAENTITGRLNLVTRTEQRTRTLATFGEATWAMLPELRLTLGGRIESDSYDTVLRSSLGGRDDVSGSSVVPLPKVSLAWDIVPEATLIGTIQRAYRAGRAGQSILSGTAYSVEPEYAWSYEAALRTRWLGGRLEVNANIFHVDLRDQQVQQFTRLNNPFDAVLVNAGRSTQQGIEAEIRFRPTGDLTTFVNGALLRTRFDDFPTPQGNLRGNEFPFAAPYSLGGGAIWRSGTGITLSGEATFLGPAYSDARNTPADRIDQRFLLDAAASYTLGPATLTVFARNLLDEKYETRRVTASGIVAPGLGRFVGVELRGTF
jgi:outer membrane receptor protein involved in Fe transport